MGICWIESIHLQDFFKVLLLMDRNIVDVVSCGAWETQTFIVTDLFHVEIFWDEV